MQPLIRLCADGPGEAGASGVERMVVDCEWRTHGNPATLFRKTLVAARHDKRHTVRTSRGVTRAGRGRVSAREGGGCQHPSKVDREFDVLAPTLTLTSTELVTARPSAFIPGANRTPRSPTSHATPVIDGASPWANDLDTPSISPSERRTPGRAWTEAGGQAHWQTGLHAIPPLSHNRTHRTGHAPGQSSGRTLWPGL